jgi:Tfp pilus assembly protein PilX
MRARLAREDGWAVVTALSVMMLMFGIGVAAYAYVDNQTRQSRVEREEESSFNLTEAAMQQQGFVLSNAWPGNAAGAFTTDCVQTTAAGTPGCPDPANLANTSGTGNFSLPDFKSGTTWQTEIRDNPVVGGSSEFWDPSVRTASCQGTGGSPCRWDANGDKKMWVRASATVRGRTRTIVALLKREELTEPFPRTAVTAGSMDVTNNGNKTVVDASGSQVVLRCTSSDPLPNSCADYDPSKGQVDPPTPEYGLPTTTALSPSQIDRFRTTAQTSNPPTYYTSCPSSLEGRVVFVEPPDTPPGGVSCQYQDTSVYNSTEAPALLIITRGSLTLKGGVEFYGIINMLNQQNWDSTGQPVVDISGNAEVHGAVAIDGSGRLDVGSSGSGGSNDANISYDPNVFNNLRSFGTAGLVQNTWRELPPGG